MAAKIRKLAHIRKDFGENDANRWELMEISNYALCLAKRAF